MRAPRESVHTSQIVARVSATTLTPEQLCRAADTPWHAQHLSLASQMTKIRREARLPGQGKLEMVAGVSPCSAKPSQDAKTPSQAAPTMLSPRASVPIPGATAGTPPGPVHTRQLLTGVYTRPVSRRLTPRRVRKSRTKPQAHPDARHTFHTPRGPPETEAKRARSVLPFV